MHDALGMLKAVEWNGYDVEDGERACPNCGAWKYQHERNEKGNQSIHYYACTLAVLIGAPCEEPDKGIYVGNGNSSTTTINRTCSECYEPQFNTPSGWTCKNNHGGASPFEYDHEGPMIDDDVPF